LFAGNNWSFFVSVFKISKYLLLSVSLQGADMFPLNVKIATINNVICFLLLNFIHFIYIYSMVLKKHNLFACILFFTLSSCTVTRVNSKLNKLPTESFVKILNTTEVSSCSNPSDPNCPIGKFVYTGSGMAIELIKGEMIVLTAGHVCDSRPTKAIKQVTQTLQAMDYHGDVHQAWAISVSHNSDQGDTDLCLLWVPTLNVPKVRFSLRTPDIGDELIYIGAPQGIFHPPTVPIFKGIYSGIIDKSSAMVTAPATGGSSGAAVLNKNNRIVGIIWGTNSKFNHVSVMTNHKAFLLFLYRTLKNIEIKSQ
jgi:hypothetical protein